MKKTLLIFLIAAFLTLTACSQGKVEETPKIYTMNASVSYGAVEDNGLQKTKVSYEIIIIGDEKDILNIDGHQPLVNPKYIDLLLENGSHTSTLVEGTTPYFEITGSFIFDTTDKTKEEISEMDFFKGTKIFDKKGTEYELILNSYDGE